MIKFDLHIHSDASKYKESSNVVDESTVDNANILLNKLNENEVALFSITDHNRFNVELYEKLDELMKTDLYPNVKGLVAGIEFDVQIDETMGKCHIITIFDAKNDSVNYQKISDVINKNLLTDPKGYYTKKEYESIISSIEMDTILIACQRSRLDKHIGKHNSLSESTSNPEVLLKVGYINALEFQKPNVEGILQDNLREMPEQVLLVSGSDCHQWTSYPFHDEANPNKAFKHSKAKILPTFKGLLMAVTSPETRINRSENSNPYYLKYFKVGDLVIPLTNGINAIIGENGSGKSTVLKMLSDEISEPYVKKLLEENEMISDHFEKNRIRHIGQGEIVSKFESHSLFDANENYIPVDDTTFIEAYRTYAQDLLNAIRKRIKETEARDVLSRKEISYSELAEKGVYYIAAEYDAEYNDFDNIHESKYREIDKLAKKLTTIKTDNYYLEYVDEINTALDILNSVLEKIKIQKEQVAIEKKVKNTIVTAITSYNTVVAPESTSHDVECREYQKKRKDLIDAVTKAITLRIEQSDFPKQPGKFEGYSQNPRRGFSFNQEKKYNGKNMMEEFMKRMFNKGYASVEALKSIVTTDALVEAVRNCTQAANIEDIYNNNFDTFIKEACDFRNYIVDASRDENLGNTLGEMSLAYLKYITQNSEDWNVFVVDQPEDHISNNNISRRLIDYFNTIRYSKQLIVATHNPLLVVNMDVDNVIHIRQLNGKLEAVQGCLEFEDNTTNILDIIANNMDGGKSTIEKRLRVYGKES